MEIIILRVFIVIGKVFLSVDISLFIVVGLGSFYVRSLSLEFEI